MKNRSRIDIYRLILETASADEGTSKTKLKYKSYLSLFNRKNTWELRRKNGLLDYEAGKPCYRITEEGTRLFQLQNKLEEFAPIHYLNIKNS